MISDDHAHRELRIGELAHRTGVSPRSLRYYEERGLLTSRRDRNGHRRYSDDVVPLVENVRRFLEAGLSVADIQQFGSCLASSALRAAPCAAALEVYEKRLRILDERIGTLFRLRSNLATQTDHLRDRIRSAAPNPWH